jgi:hypothetical protein
LNLSRAGLAINSFATLLVAFFILASLFVLAWRRPIIDGKGAFYGILFIICALLWIGRPLLLHGFNWVAFSNEDAHFYRNNALRLLHHGFFEIPKSPLLLTDRDDSAPTFFASPLQGGYRPLFDLFLALVGAVSRISIVKIYMPIVASLFALEAAAAVTFGASILPRATSRRVKVALLLISLTAIFAASSAIAVGGELGPQIIGITLLASILAISGEREGNLSEVAWMRWAFGAAILGAGLLEGYAEVAPFLFGSFVVAVFLRPRQVIATVRAQWQLILKCSLVLIGTIALALNAQLIGTLYLISFVVGGTSESAGQIQYPAYLIPTGPAVLWGIFPSSASQQSGASQLLIGLGLVIMALYFVSVLRMRIAAPRLFSINVIIIALGFLLFTKRADFGLYKLTMYAQPFIWPVLIVSAMLLRTGWLRLASAVALACVVAKSASTSKYYVDRSMDRFSDTKDDFVEVRGATSDALLDRITTLATQIGDRDVILATSNDLVEKYVKDMIHPRFLITPAFRTGAFAMEKPVIRVPFLAALAKQAAPLTQTRSQYFDTTDFKLPVGDGIATDVQNDNRSLRLADRSKPVILLGGRDTSVVNLCELSSASDRESQQLYRDDDGHDLLAPLSLPLPRELVRKYSAQAPEFVGTDPILGGLMSASPNLLAYRVLNPSLKIRLLIDYTATFNQSPYKKIPDIEIIGNRKVELPIAGEGRARLLSDPISPFVLGQARYVFISIKQPLFRFRSKRTGLAALYGNDIQTDLRQIAGFLREVSAIGADDEPDGCHSNTAPEKFLSNVKFFSGLFEDGWLSPDVFLEGGGTPFSSLELRGDSPWLGGHANVLTVTAGGFRKSIEISPGRSLVQVKFPRPINDRVSLHFAAAVGPLSTDERRLSYLADLIQLR